MNELLNDINSSCEKNIGEDTLNKLFEHCWDEFILAIDSILSQEPIKKDKNEKNARPIEEIIEEVLSLTREIRNNLSFRVEKLENQYEPLIVDRKIREKSEILNSQISIRKNLHNRNILKPYKDEIMTEIVLLWEQGYAKDMIVGDICEKYAIPYEICKEIVNEALLLK